jgi:hypothetical protein
MQQQWLKLLCNNAWAGGAAVELSLLHDHNIVMNRCPVHPTQRLCTASSARAAGQTLLASMCCCCAVPAVVRRPQAAGGQWTLPRCRCPAPA